MLWLTMNYLVREVSMYLIELFWWSDLVFSSDSEFNMESFSFDFSMS